VDFQPGERLSGEHARFGGVRSSQVDGCHVIAVAGELDLYSGPSLRTSLYALAERDPAPHIVVDLGGLTFLDSTGLGVLVGALKRLRTRGGSLRLAGCHGPVHEVLVITGLHQTFSLFDTVPEAVHDCRAAAEH
jgi:anti-sigma B factor antagonist